MAAKVKSKRTGETGSIDQDFREFTGYLPDPLKESVIENPIINQPHQSLLEVKFA